MRGIIIYSSFRPTAEEVCCHCLFWLEKQQLQFFMEVHSYTMDKTSPAFNAIEEKASTVFKGDWKDLITSDDLKSGQYLISFLNS